MALIKGFPHDGIVTINRVILKKGRTLDELQERVALMCENVKTYHSETGFIGGMVVLNSGQISNEGSSLGKALESDLKNTVNSIEEISQIELLAIGIGHDVTRYYKRAVKITDVQDLGDAMINQLTDLFSEKKKSKQKAKNGFR